MKAITIFDKPMCCSTGVCGPNVDPVLVRFADDLRWLASQGVTIQRHNPAQNANPFVQDKAVCEIMRTDGEGVLPLVFVDGGERSRQRYPDRDELAEWCGLAEVQEVPEREGGACCNGTECC